MRAYRGGTLVLAVLTVLLGLAMIVTTLVRGGGIGVLVGALFLAAGAGRLYLLRGGRP